MVGIPEIQDSSGGWLENHLYREALFPPGTLRAIGGSYGSNPRNHPRRSNRSKPSRHWDDQHSYRKLSHIWAWAMLTVVQGCFCCPDCCPSRCRCWPI